MCDTCNPGYLWKWNKKCNACTKIKNTEKIKHKEKINKARCDVCYEMKPLNKWYDDEFFICNKCIACEYCNKIDDKIQKELDINEITNCCANCT
jgi:hypothetical protein